MNKLKKKVLILSIKKVIRDLVENEVWVSKDGCRTKVVDMVDRHLLFSHRFLSNKIDNLSTLDDFNFDGEIFKLSILAVEGLNIFVKEINRRNLNPLPSESEVSLDFNESLKSKNELSFKKEYIKKGK